jgi:hypothetical protein
MKFAFHQSMVKARSVEGLLITAILPSRFGETKSV